MHFQRCMSKSAELKEIHARFCCRRHLQEKVPPHLETVSPLGVSSRKTSKINFSLNSQMVFTRFALTWWKWHQKLVIDCHFPHKYLCVLLPYIILFSQYSDCLSKPAKQLPEFWLQKKLAFEKHYTTHNENTNNNNTDNNKTNNYYNNICHGLVITKFVILINYFIFKKTSEFHRYSPFDALE